MNIIHRLPKSSIHINQYRITALSHCTQNAFYSINSVQRTTPVHFLQIKSHQFIPQRNLSFIEKFASVYQSIADSSTVAAFQKTFISFHDITGLPWWATIIIYTAGIRLALFPLGVYTHKIKARLHLISMNEMPKIAKELHKEVTIAKHTRKLSDRQSRMLFNMNLKSQYQKLIERDNCHPFKTTVTVWFQFPIWICQSIALRNICSLRPDPNAYSAIIAFTQLSVGGFIWIPNLIENDVSYILPVTMALFNLTNIEMQMLENPGKSSKFLTVFTSIFRILTVAMVPIAASVPSCMTLYWTTSAACAFLQNSLLLSPKVRKLCGIPQTSYHMDRPYRTLVQRFVQKMRQRKEWCTSLFTTKKIKENIK